jgi:hypothetical protein
MAFNALDTPLTQRYCCVDMIPEFIDIGSPWPVLPPGVHDAALDEVKNRFAVSDRRKFLFAGFENAVAALRDAGCRVILLDGSFVTAKPVPGDFDVCWETAGVDPTKLDPIFLDFSDKRKRQKQRFGGEFFPAHALADVRHCFRDYFQVDKYTGRTKGIICIRFP